MPIQMKVSEESIKQFKPLDNGWYVLRLIGFKPKKSKDGNSVNFNPQFEPVQKVEGRAERVFATGSEKMGQFLLDFAHGMGFPIKIGEVLPGAFEGDEKNPETWQYKGPLLGKTCEVELVSTQWQNNPEKNEIRQFRCKVPNCQEKHSTNLISKSK